MKITLLGTGTPAPSLERQSSGYLIEVGGDLIVMDHGPGAHHRLIESGHRVARMTELLFGEEGVYGPDIRARIEHESSVFVFQERGGKPPRKRPAPQVKEAQAGDVIESPGWKVTVGKASHVQPLLECLAFRLDSDEGSMCYSGDSGGVCEELIELARGCDVAILMNHYLSGTEPTASYRAACGNHRDNAVIARRAGVKTLVLTHVLARIDQPDIREQIIREIKQEFDGDVIWGEDLMRLMLAEHGLVKIEQANSLLAR